MQTIQIQNAGRRIIGTSTNAGFWQIMRGDKVIGWATSYAAAKLKADQLAGATA